MRQPAQERPMMPNVSVLIVSYHSRDRLDACLTSVLSQTERTCEVIVVDNASADGSAALLRERYPQVRLIENAANVGFAAAVNQAAQVAQGRYLFLLNPDALVVDKAVDTLVAFLDEHPEVGICAPRVLDEQGRLQHNAYRFPTLASSLWLAWSQTPWRLLLRRPRRAGYDLTSDQPQGVDAAAGCALAISSALWRQLGGLDEGFFLYGEDTDLCWRAWRDGRQVVYMPAAAVIHAGGGSTATTDNILLSHKLGAHMLRSRYRFLAKTRGRRAADLFWAAVRLTGLALLAAARLPAAQERRTRWRALGRLFWDTQLQVGFES